MTRLEFLINLNDTRDDYLEAAQRMLDSGKQRNQSIRKRIIFRRVLTTLLAAILVLFSTFAVAMAASPDFRDWVTSLTERKQHAGSSSAWRPQNAYGACFIETEKYTYILENKKIYRAALYSDSFTVLCSKPDCGHVDETCDAYGGVAIGFYNGKLYSVTLDMNGVSLNSMNPDGSSHSVVCQLPCSPCPDGSISGFEFFCFSDGSLYYMTHAPLYEDSPELYCTRLQTGETEKLCADSLLSGVYGGLISQFEGGKWYMNADLTENGETKSSIIQIDLLDESLTPILDNPGGKRAMWWTVLGDSLLYFEPGRGICQYNWLNDRDCCLMEDPGGRDAECFFGVDYIYISCASDIKAERTLSIYSWDFQLVDTVNYPSHYSYVTETSGRIYFGVPNWGYYMKAYLNKSEIGTGALKLNPVEYVQR